ncbi:GNAT family N-acetyltransferase [Paraglaciecola sp. T6c]|uniref:GNAT family N-acetyltransferase n=1 Tax=Pseudoalteromonas atlantica (strain T6c / ATCC BAA-1087) TaxID=3042615 RepID=UPI001E3583B0|nr:GNAT family N-acetyltransferase [Paraglaciecola sp. T6c]
MSQLRPHLSKAQFIEQVKVQKGEGFQLLQAKYSNGIAGLAGFRISQNLAWGKHLYIDDLVTDKDTRSKGIGFAMLNWLEEHAKTKNCAQIHLDSGVQRFQAHKFYLRSGFVISSHHFAKTL